MFLGVEGVGLLVLGFWLWAIFDVIKTDESLTRNLPKGVWLMLVIILSDVGALAWLLLGRPEGVGFKPGDTTPRGSSSYVPGPVDAADRRRTRAEARAEYEDLDRRLNAERAERMAQLRAEADERARNDQRKKDLADWEADLLRRERELREKATQPTED
jgi:hypothetical protein